MKYAIICCALLVGACNTSSTEKSTEYDSAKTDGTRLTDTLPVSDSIPPAVTNPQPD